MNVEKFTKGLIYGEGYTIAKVLRETKNSNYDIPAASTLSYLMKTGRIRFSTVCDIANFLGYKIVVKKK